MTRATYSARVERRDASFVRSAGLVSALTLASRVLGLVREAVCAYFFGAGELWGDFSIAFRIPNLSRRLFGEGALSAAFIPVLSGRLHTEGRSAARHMLGAVALLLAVVLAALVVAGELGLWIAGRHFDAAVLSLTGVMLPYMVFICLVALLAGAQHVIGRFTAPALMPVLFNVILIAGVVAGAGLGDQRRHLYMVAVVVVGAGVVQVVWQWVALARAQFKPEINWNPRHPDVHRIVATMMPMMIGLAAVQLNSLADLLVAKLLVQHAGAAAVLSYAERLYQMPIGLFGAALATAIFPALARLASQGDSQAFAQTLLRGVRLAVLLGVPASVGLFAVSTPAVQAVYERGQFDASATWRVAQAVSCYSLGVWAYVALQVLIRAYHSLQDAKTPMRVAAAMVGLNLALNLLLVRWFAESGIAVATAISSAVQVLLLVWLMPRAGLSLPWAQVAPTVGKVLLASAAMYGALKIVGGLFPLAGGGPWRQIGGLLLLVFVGAGIFATVAWLLGCGRDLRAAEQR